MQRLAGRGRRALARPADGVREAAEAEHEAGRRCAAQKVRTGRRSSLNQPPTTDDTS
jgi:hypothetical protein